MINNIILFITTYSNKILKKSVRLKDDLPSLIEEINGLEKTENYEQTINYWNEVEYGLVGLEKIANVIKFYKKIIAKPRIYRDYIIENN